MRTAFEEAYEEFLDRAALSPRPLDALAAALRSDTLWADRDTEPAPPPRHHEGWPRITSHGCV